MDTDTYQNSMVAMLAIIVILIFIGLVFVGIVSVTIMNAANEVKKVTDKVIDFGENVVPKIGNAILKEIPVLTSQLLDVDNQNPEDFTNSGVPEINDITQVLNNVRSNDPKVREFVKYARPILFSLGNVIDNSMEQIEDDPKTNKQKNTKSSPKKNVQKKKAQ